MFETTFNNLDDTLRKDAGCSSELDYIEQTSWVLFLKYIDDYEKDKETTAKLNGEIYSPIISEEYSWTTWAAPKTSEAKIDFNAALSGDDLIDFVDNQLFPYLKKFRTDAESANTLEYKIGEIFSEIKNKLQSGYSLREVINKVDKLHFRSNEEKYEMSSLYEGKIKKMGNAGRNGGEYYTPRPLIKTIVEIVDPKLGDKVYDGAVGSAGFLCQAYDYLRKSKELTVQEYETLQQQTFYGKEKKSLAYIIGIMNMILHGIEAPNILHTNTLLENILDIQEKDKVDIVLANPPFGGKERTEVQENFPVKTSETAYLFLQHFIKILKHEGRAGIVIKSTFLTANDNTSIALRKILIEETSLDAVLILPKNIFAKTPATTAVLFFQKGSSTKSIWFYKLKPEKGMNFGITNPLTEDNLDDFRERFKTKSISENSWNTKIEELNDQTFSLPIMHPDADPLENMTPSEEIKKSLMELGAETNALIEKIGSIK